MRLTLRKIIIAVSAPCSSEFDKLLASYDVPVKYKAAFEYFDAEKYNRAAELFESLSLSTRGTAQDDTVQYYWALSNYKFKDYVTAESNFTQFLSVFPSSPFTVEAEFIRIDCLFRMSHRYELDQTPTHKCLLYVDRFMIERNQPENEKYLEPCRKMQADLNERLDKKAYEAAHLYYHMDDYLAAHYALKNVLKEDADNIYREDILYYTCMSAYKYAANSIEEKQKERYMTFMDDYYQFVSEYPESKKVKELEALYAKVNRIIKRKGLADEE